MNYLIFRTDRIGDYLIISPLIKAIKRNNSNNKVYIVCSKKNIDFVIKDKLVEKTFVLDSNRLTDKFKLFFELKKNRFDKIIVSDKKNRSILITLFLKSNNKVFNISKYFQKKILNLFYKNVFLDNDNNKNESIKDILINNSNALGINLKDEDFHYLQLNQFLKEFTNEDFLKLKIDNFVLFHYDEKWELDNYKKLYKKASTFTKIDTDLETFKEFLFELSEKTSKKVIITTGTINTKLLSKLKETSLEINKSFYEITIKSKKIYLLTDESFFSISHLISKSSLFISCHGAFTHIASNYKVKILDIIEKNKTLHYCRITKHMKNYKYLFRDNFSILSKEIITNL
tara:strand:+ start:2923 stop:3954 length:1032 start_codon:yes stop_codon:yes gene_type:complete